MVKSIPQRMCVGCRAMRDKKQLIRVVRRPEEAGLTVDLSGKMPGRGAYLCPDEVCFKKAVKSRGLERAFKMKVDESLWQRVREQIEEKN
ncbi:MAG: YlxR family protein [Clostridiales bacterium]|jgi:predicted RNA-binding protein YlxR (DUF448 family)|nr:YlxR family protein [Clostridiales bacterium]